MSEKKLAKSCSSYRPEGREQLHFDSRSDLHMTVTLQAAARLPARCTALRHLSDELSCAAPNRKQVEEGGGQKSDGCSGGK